MCDEVVSAVGDEFQWVMFSVFEVDESDYMGNMGVQINEVLNLCLYRMLMEGFGVLWG